MESGSFFLNFIRINRLVCFRTLPQCFRIDDTLVKIIFVLRNSRSKRVRVSVIFPRRDDPEIVPLDTFTFFLEKKKKKKQWHSFKIIIIIMINTLNQLFVARYTIGRIRGMLDSSIGKRELDAKILYSTILNYARLETFRSLH